MLGDLARALLVDRTLDAGDHQRQHREYRYLSREGFGRSHADLRPYVDVSAGIGSPGDRRADHVADAIDERTVLLGQLDSGQRVGRFARLRYGDHDVVGINHRIAVTELRSVFHFDRNAAEILDQVLPDERCVPRGAASHEDDAPGVEKPLSVVHDARQDHVVRLGVDPAPNAVHDGLGLLEDLLEHEVRIAALFELGDAELQLLDVDLALLVVERYDLQRVVAIHDHYLAVIDIDDLVRIFHDRRRVRCQEKLLVADTDDHRAAAACRDDLILVALLHYGDSVCADHLLQCLLDGLQQRAVVRRTDVFDQIDQYLRVSVALECVTVFDQRLFQHPVIFDDTIVDQGDIARIGVVGMGVDVVRFAVCRPTGVGDADRSVQILGFDEMFQIGDFALAFEHVQNSFPIDQCESCAVVTAIFQAVKSFYQNGVSLPFTHVTYNSTHNVIFLRFAKIVEEQSCELARKDC